MLWIWLDTPSVQIFNKLHKILNISCDQILLFHNNNLDIIKIIVNNNWDILGIFNKITFESILIDSISDIELMKVNKTITFYKNNS